MRKIELINLEIEKLEKEIERLRLLSHGVSGETLDICTNCNTKNLHWSINNVWTCAFC